jgi:hypothetical protein
LGFRQKFIFVRRPGKRKRRATALQVGIFSWDRNGAPPVF